MNINDITEQKLKIAIKHNKIIDYLEGKGVFKINSDPRDLNSLHTYNFSIECYNNVSKNNPQLRLDILFEREIIAKLSSDECNFIDVYCLFNCLVAQLRLEDKGLSSFKVSNEKLKIMLELLKKQSLLHQENLKRCKYERGITYTDGLYGYIFDENDKFYNETGKKILWTEEELKKEEENE